MFTMFGSIIHNRAIVYKRKTFLKIVVHGIISDQCNQSNRALDEIQITVIYSRGILVTVTWVLLIESCL